MKNRISSYYASEIHCGHNVDEDGIGYLWIRIIFGRQCHVYTNLAHDVHKIVEWVEGLYLPEQLEEDAFGALAYHFELVSKKCVPKNKFEKMIDWCIGFREDDE